MSLCSGLYINLDIHSLSLSFICYLSVETEKLAVINAVQNNMGISVLARVKQCINLAVKIMADLENRVPLLRVIQRKDFMAFFWEDRLIAVI